MSACAIKHSSSFCLSTANATHNVQWNVAEEEEDRPARELHLVEIVLIARASVTEQIS